MSYKQNKTNEMAKSKESKTAKLWTKLFCCGPRYGMKLDLKTHPNTYFTVRCICQNLY